MDNRQYYTKFIVNIGSNNIIKHFKKKYLFYICFYFLLVYFIYTVFHLVHSPRPTGFYVQILIYPLHILTLKLTELYEFLMEIKNSNFKIFT